VSANTVTHIPENRIVRIIADGDAHAAEQEHLDRCGHCRTTLAGLQADLEHFRRQAALAVPEPAKHFVLPADRPERNAAHRWRIGWAALGTALSIVLLVLFLRMGDGWHLPGLSSPAPQTAKWEDPEMTEVDKLVENPLPESYLALSDSLDEDYEEGFIDFLIPPLNGNPVS